MSPRSQSVHHKLETYYIGDSIDLKALEGGLKEYPHIDKDHPLVLTLAKNQYAALTRFGTVGLWNCTDNLKSSLFKKLAPFVKNPRDPKKPDDTLIIHVGPQKEKITFDEIYLRSLDIEKIKIVSYVSAQSAALDRYEHDITRELHELGKVAQKLKGLGVVPRFKERETLRRVGHVLSIKQNVVSNLALLDKPDETWEREELEKLYDHLRSEYDLHDRFGILNEKVGLLSEYNTLLLNFAATQKSNFLELVVIVLIAIEILIFTPDILKIFTGGN